MSGRYVKVAEDGVLVELTPDEWAVALDALERAQADRGNGYSPANRSALTRAVRKFGDAAGQLRRAG